MPRSIENRLLALEALRAKARAGGGAARREKQHKAGKLTALERVELLGDPGLLRGDGHLRRPPLPRLRDGRRRERDSGRRRRRGRRARRGPPRLRLRAGLHGLRRVAVGDERREDLQGHGPRDEGGRARRGPQRLGRRAHPGRRRLSRGLRRHLPAQHARLRRRPADLGGARPLRGRRRLLAGDHGLRPHGAGHELDVRDRARRHQDRHARGRHEGNARRRRHARVRLGRRAHRRRLGRGLPPEDPHAPLVPSLEQPRGSSAPRDRGSRRTARIPSWTVSSRPRRTSLTT